MAYTNTVCSMCGDVGFPDKIFRCNRCRSRFQHSYCSNYYGEEPMEAAGVCDWCLSAERKHAGRPLEKLGSSSSSPGKRSEEYSNTSGSDRAVRREDSSRSRGKSSTPSKQSGRKYKLLKDVLC